MTATAASTGRMVKASAKAPAYGRHGAPQAEGKSHHEARHHGAALGGQRLRQGDAEREGGH